VECRRWIEREGKIQAWRQCVQKNAKVIAKHAGQSSLVVATSGKMAWELALADEVLDGLGEPPTYFLGMSRKGMPKHPMGRGSHRVPDDQQSILWGTAATSGAMAMADDPELLFDSPRNAAITIALAHGAGAGMDTPFMKFFAAGLADKGYRVARFEFPYMAARRATGKGKPPDREPILRETWLKVIEKQKAKRLVIGGKSMGGRIASLVADEAEVAGLVCFGYPFHPVAKPDKLRVEHLAKIKTPTLIVQGERDPFGSKDEVAGYKLSSNIRIAWMKDGDHDFKPRKASGRTQEQNGDAAIQEIGAFMAR
jgi:uncharacterized protein